MAKLQQLNSISGGQAADMKFTSSIKGKESFSGTITLHLTG